MSSHSRDLFDVYIFYTNSGNATGPTSAPTSRPNIRNGNYRSCNSGIDDDDDDEGEIAITQLQFIYEVETKSSSNSSSNSTDDMSTLVEDALTGTLSNALLDTLYDSTVCTGQQQGQQRRSRDLGWWEEDGVEDKSIGHTKNDLSSSKPQRRLQEQQMVVDSLGAGTKDKIMGPCTPNTDTGATSCLRYQGSLLVAYSMISEDDGTNSSSSSSSNQDTDGVRSRVVDQIQSDMATGVLVDSVNARGSLQTDFDLVVTNITYISTLPETQAGDFMNIASSQSGFYTIEEDKLNLLGKSFMGFCSVLLMLAFLLSWCSRRHRRKQVEPQKYYNNSINNNKYSTTTNNNKNNRKRELAKLVQEPSDGYLHDEDEITEQQRTNKNDEDSEIQSYVSADYHDLGSPHSKIDVHRCNKKNCQLCSSSNRATAATAVAAGTAKTTLVHPYPRTKQLSPIGELSSLESAMRNGSSDGASSVSSSTQRSSHQGLEVVDGIYRKGQSLLDQFANEEDVDEFFAPPMPAESKPSRFGMFAGRRKDPPVPGRAVHFIKVGDVGMKRRVMDPYGLVRDEVEL
jgi:hypothetical protein